MTSILSTSAVATVGDVARRRRQKVLVVTGVVSGCPGECDHVALYADGRHAVAAGAATDVEVGFIIPDSHMPKSACRAVAFRDVPEGPARIHVKPAQGAERYYSVNIGSGYKIPWHASWRLRGCEAYWCGD